VAESLNVVVILPDMDRGKILDPHQGLGLFLKGAERLQSNVETLLNLLDRLVGRVAGANHWDPLGHFEMSGVQPRAFLERCKKPERNAGS
jgi:hypothetical protein